MSINRVNISGNLTRDPELRTTPNGMAVLTIGMAVNDRHRNNQTGEWGDYANYVNCIVFGKRAEALASHLSKGSKVAIEGKLHYSQWESDGQKRSKIEVVVDEIEFVGARDQSASVAPVAAVAPPPAMRPAQSYSQQRMAGTPQPKAPSLYDEDLPF